MEQIPGAQFLGFGMNVVQSTPENALTAAIVTPVSGSSGTYEYNSVDYTVPSNVAATPGTGDGTTKCTVIIGSSQSEFQEEFAAGMGISGSYNALSGTFNAEFTSEVKSQQQYWYAVATGNFEAFTLLLDEETGNQLSPDFLNDADVQAMLTQSSFDSSNAAIFFRVFNKWGTHYVYQVKMGANFQYFTAIQATYSSDSATISANLSLEYDAVFVSASAESKTEWTTLGQSWANARQVSLSASGGDTALLAALAPTFGDDFSSEFTAWRLSIPANLGVMQYYLHDLSTLLDGVTQDAVSEAIQSYLAAGLYAQASFNTTTAANTSIATLIRVGSQIIAPNPPAPSNNQYGGMQLVVVNPSSLDVLANLAVYPEDSTTIAASWEKLLSAVQSLSGQDYFVALTVFGGNNVLSFPPADVASWLQSCGATLSAWTTATQTYCGEDYGIGYAFIGQNGLTPGDGIETFTIDQAASVPKAGYYYANVTGPLIPDEDGGAYTLCGAAQLTRATT